MFDHKKFEAMKTHIQTAVSLGRPVHVLCPSELGDTDYDILESLALLAKERIPPLVHYREGDPRLQS